MTTSLDGTMALIPGAGSGIGESFRQEFAGRKLRSIIVEPGGWARSSPTIRPTEQQG